MDRTEGFYKIDQLIRARGVVSLDALLTELEVSRATLKRDLGYLRDRLQLPIVHDRKPAGKPDFERWAARPRSSCRALICRTTGVIGR
jgi:DeoR/GlpR family transcriptional regulator of sugar metabolism